MKAVSRIISVDKFHELMILLNLPKNYRWQISNFLRYCEENSLKPTAFAFKQATDQLYSQVQENRLSASTYNLYLSANRQLIMKLMQYRKATAVELFAAAQIMKSRAIQIDPCNDASTVLTPKEINALIDYATPRGKLIFEVLKITALRISEALKLPKRMMVTGDHAQAKIVAKGGKTREVFIPKDLYDAIVAEFKGNYFLFETKRGKALDRKGVLKMLKVAANKAVAAGKASSSLLSKAKLHNFRHAWAHKALSKQIDLHTVATFLGHASTETCSKHYIRKKPSASQILCVYETDAA